jgi:hypothetical protein
VGTKKSPADDDGADLLGMPRSQAIAQKHQGLQTLGILRALAPGAMPGMDLFSLSY